VESFPTSAKEEVALKAVIKAVNLVTEAIKAIRAEM